MEKSIYDYLQADDFRFKFHLSFPLIIMNMPGRIFVMTNNIFPAFESKCKKPHPVK